MDTARRFQGSVHALLLQQGLPGLRGPGPVGVRSPPWALEAGRPPKSGQGVCGLAWGRMERVMLLGEVTGGTSENSPPALGPHGPLLRTPAPQPPPAATRAFAVPGACATPPPLGFCAGCSPERNALPTWNSCQRAHPRDPREETGPHGQQLVAWPVSGQTWHRALASFPATHCLRLRLLVSKMGSQTPSDPRHADNKSLGNREGETLRGVWPGPRPPRE